MKMRLEFVLERIRTAMMEQATLDQLPLVDELLLSWRELVTLESNDRFLAVPDQYLVEDSRTCTDIR